MEQENPSSTQGKKPWYQGGLLNYKDKGSQTVISFLGFELTAPASLKQPGIVYIAFIIINLTIFIFLRNLVIN